MSYTLGLLHTTEPSQKLDAESPEPHVQDNDFDAEVNAFCHVVCEYKRHNFFTPDATESTLYSDFRAIYSPWMVSSMFTPHYY